MEVSNCCDLVINHISLQRIMLSEMHCLCNMIDARHLTGGGIDDARK